MASYDDGCFKYESCLVCPRLRCYLDEPNILVAAFSEGLADALDAGTVTANVVSYHFGISTDAILRFHGMAKSGNLPTYEISAATQQEIVAAYTHTPLSVNALALQFDLSPKKIRRILEHHGVHVKVKKHSEILSR